MKLPNAKIELACAKHEARANARLIAAAPDLLAVLRECAEFIPQTTEGGSNRGYALQQSIHAAIAKATGA